MQDPVGKYGALSKYARDLTAAARNGKLDPVIGHDDDIRRAIQVVTGDVPSALQVSFITDRDLSLAMLQCSMHASCIHSFNELLFLTVT